MPRSVARPTPAEFRAATRSPTRRPRTTSSTRDSRRRPAPPSDGSRLPFFVPQRPPRRSSSAGRARVQRLGRPVSARRPFDAAARPCAERPARRSSAAAVGRFEKERPAAAFSRLGPLTAGSRVPRPCASTSGSLLLWIGAVADAENAARNGRRRRIEIHASAGKRSASRPSLRLGLRKETDGPNGLWRTVRILAQCRRREGRVDSARLGHKVRDGAGEPGGGAVSEKTAVRHRARGRRRLATRGSQRLLEAGRRPAR